MQAFWQGVIMLRAYIDVSIFVLKRTQHQSIMYPNIMASNNLPFNTFQKSLKTTRVFWNGYYEKSWRNHPSLCIHHVTIPTKGSIHSSLLTSCESLSFTIQSVPLQMQTDLKKIATRIKNQRTFSEDNERNCRYWAFSKTMYG